MKTAFIVTYILTLFLMKETAVEKPSIVVIISTSVAMVVRILWEIVNNKNSKLTFTKTLLIILVSLFIPLATSLILPNIEFVQKYNMTIILLFFIGLVSLDLANFLIKKAPSFLEKIGNFLIKKIDKDGD